MTSRLSATTIGLMNYREQAAAFDLAHLVLSYWEFTVADGANGPLIHEVFADGCVSLFYHRNIAKNISRLDIVGTRLDSLRTEVFAGDIYWGARLSPAACPSVLGCNPATLHNRILTFSQLLPQIASKLFRQLNTAGSFAEAIAAYDSCLRSMGLAPADVDAEVAAAVRFIEASKGQAKIAEVAAAVGLSVRQLERRFRAVVGLTPKQFARIRRVRTTAVALVEDGETNWATRATEMGFADQSHLTREFVAVTGRSPASFAEDVARINHGNLVK